MAEKERDEEGLRKALNSAFADLMKQLNTEQPQQQSADVEDDFDEDDYVEVEPEVSKPEPEPVVEKPKKAETTKKEPKKEEPTKEEPQVKVRKYMTEPEIMEYVAEFQVTSNMVTNELANKKEFRDSREKKFVATVRKYVDANDSSIFDIIDRSHSNYWLKMGIGWSRQEESGSKYPSLDKLASAVNSTRVHDASYVEDGETIKCSHLHKGLRECFLSGITPRLASDWRQIEVDNKNRNLLSIKTSDAGFSGIHDENLKQVLLATMTGSLEYNDYEFSYDNGVKGGKQQQQIYGNVVKPSQLIKLLAEKGIKNMSSFNALVKKSKDNPTVIKQEEADIVKTGIHIMNENYSKLESMFTLLNSSYYIKKGFYDVNEFVNIGSIFDSIIKQQCTEQYNYAIDDVTRSGNIAHVLLCELWYSGKEPNNLVIFDEETESKAQMLGIFNSILNTKGESGYVSKLQSDAREIAVAIGACMKYPCLYQNGKIYTAKGGALNTDFTPTTDSMDNGTTGETNTNKKGTDSSDYSTEFAKTATYNVDDAVKNRTKELQDLTKEMAKDKYFADSEDFQRVIKLVNQLDKNRAEKTKFNVKLGEKLCKLGNVLQGMCTPSGMDITESDQEAELELEDFEEGTTKEEKRKACANFRKRFTEELLRNYEKDYGDLTRLTTVAVVGDTITFNNKTYPVSKNNLKGVPSGLLEAVKSNNYASVFDYSYLSKMPRLSTFECDSESFCLSVVMADLNSFRLDPVAIFALNRHIWYVHIANNKFERDNVEEKMKECNYYKPSMICTYKDRFGKFHGDLVSGSWDMTKQLFKDGKYIRGTALSIWTGANKILHLGGELVDNIGGFALKKSKYAYKKGRAKL